MLSREIFIKKPTISFRYLIPTAMMTVLLSFMTVTSASANETFGIRGLDGRDALPARDGQPGSRISIFADGTAQSYMLRGENGEDSFQYAEDGSPAYNCYQPTGVRQNLIGASGGNGGRAARGGNGGNGGDVRIQLNNESELNNLRFISIVNSGGRAGQSRSLEGRGAPGCQCVQSTWQVTICKWQLVKIGDPTLVFDRLEQECSSDSRFPTPPLPPPARDGYEWRLNDTRYESYQCTSGEHGRNGQRASNGQDGSYGDISVVVGLDKETDVAHWTTKLGNIIDKTYILAGYIEEFRNGMINLLRSGSDVKNGYRFLKYAQQKVKFAWKPKKTPQEVGADRINVSVALGGTVASPDLNFNIPPQLTHKILKQGDTTLVTFTHLLGTTDKNKINACAKHHAKGAYVCEFSGQCRYEDGDCIPAPQ
jgi:hypothetical protein